MARMQVQRQRVPDPPIVPSTPPQILKPQLQPESETFGSREKILLKVQNKNGSAQSIRIYSVSSSLEYIDYISNTSWPLQKLEDTLVNCLNIDTLFVLLIALWYSS